MFLLAEPPKSEIPFAEKLRKYLEQVGYINVLVDDSSIILTHNNEFYLGEYTTTCTEVICNLESEQTARLLYMTIEFERLNRDARKH